MHSQQQNDNILFSSPSPSTVAEDHVRISQAGAVVALSKGPLLMLSKPNRNERLGAAATAALATCGDGDGDDGDGGDATSEPVLAACYPNPDFSTGPANDDRLISSILGAMPSLPGSPLSQSTASPGASRLVQRSPDDASFCRYANATSGTFSGGRQTGRKGVDSPVIAKSQSDRVVPVSRLRGSSGYAVAVHDDVARESVDAAADAVTLTTRQISELSLAVAAVAGADEDYDGAAAAAEVGPALLVSINSADAAVLDRAKGSLNSSAAPSPSLSLPLPQANGDAAFRANLASAAQYRIGHGHSVNAVAPLLPLLASFDTPLPLQAGRNLQSDRPQARCPTSAPAGCTSTVSGEEGYRGGGEARSGEMASRQRPKWLERLLRAFHANRQLGGGKGTSSEEDSKESSSGGGGDYGGCAGHGGHGGGGGGGGIGKMPGYSGDGGKSGAAHGDMQPEDSDGGGDGRDGGRGVGRAGIDGKPDGYRGAGAGAADAANVTTATNVRSTRDQLITRLLSNRLSHRPRSKSEELPLTVMASRDSTTVHRARLAQHAREPRATTPSITRQRVDGAVAPRSAVARYGIVGVNDSVAALTRKHDTGGSADGAAPVMGTAHKHAACDATTSVTAPVAGALEFSRPFDFRQVRSSTPARGAIAHHPTNTTTTGRRGVGLSIARRLRQFSAPGGRELPFTPLSHMATHSVGGTDWAEDAGDDRESDLIKEDLTLRVTHRLFFRR
ncbi:hypothetical protein Vretimale_8620 [Volvox reticuliferus]|uniref:Uncharacterized protein n=1 Tax=Volvox reticuliferus TaxID=1737510 RepID=A0A8J4GB52_9CHLO|nr:hypothetical protein Vretifemale_6450 [Volvox reticuliferus]GIM03983.1 hypothetical protein Vretimale_8620 [Volvox reticuliferus]